MCGEIACLAATTDEASVATHAIITMAAMVTCVLFTLLPPTPLVPLHSHTRAPSPILRVQKEPSQPAAPTFELPAILQPELAIGGGMLLLTLLVGNRLFTEDLLNSQSRADLIATVAPVLIILKALGDLDITPKEADPVPPVGVATAWVEPSLPSAVQSELQWAAESVLIPPCTAAALWRDGRTLMLQGTLPSASAADPASCVKPGPLLEKAAARKSGAPDYLPALQLLPAATLEFAYLPENAQGVLMLPLSGDAPGALVLAADRQRGFGEEDISWAREVARKLSEVV